MCVCVRQREGERKSLNAISEWHRPGHEPRLTAATLEMWERETDRPMYASAQVRLQNYFDCQFRNSFELINDYITTKVLKITLCFTVQTYSL